jgi:heme A synthase
VLALVGYLLQAGVGAMVVLSRAAEIWAAGHVGFAAATWALLVALLVIETSNTSTATAERLEGEWRAQSEALLN